MSNYELLSLLVAIVAVLVSFVSLQRTRKTEARQLELQEAQAKLAEFQYKVLSVEQEAARKADLRVELHRSGKDSFFEFSNAGQAVAKGVTFAFYNTGGQSPVLSEQFNALFPLAELSPGESRRLRAVIFMQSPSYFEGEISWTDLDGSNKSKRVKVVR